MDDNIAARTRAAATAEQAWKHAEEHHNSDHIDNASLQVDYLRALVAELRWQRINTRG